MSKFLTSAYTYNPPTTPPNPKPRVTKLLIYGQIIKVNIIHYYSYLWMKSSVVCPGSCGSWNDISTLTHLEVREEALILKNVHLLWLATHLPISVLPVPGGPNNSNPFGGPLRPVKMSLQKNRNLLSRPHKKMYNIFSNNNTREIANCSSKVRVFLAKRLAEKEKLLRSSK